jgi:hypothetical protein
MTPEEQLSILWTYVEADIPTRPYVAFDVAFGGKAAYGQKIETVENTVNYPVPA